MVAWRTLYTEWSPLAFKKVSLKSDLYLVPALSVQKCSTARSHAGLQCAAALLLNPMYPSVYLFGIFTTTILFETFAGLATVDGEYVCKKVEIETGAVPSFIEILLMYLTQNFV